MRELAEKAVNPHLMTIATLTGHAVLTVGSGYSVSCVNTYYSFTYCHNDSSNDGNGGGSGSDTGIGSSSSSNIVCSQE